MAQDYSKLKNADLEGLLKERGLPHTGKKAEMVARLVDDDKAKQSLGSGAGGVAAPAAGAAAKEDEIDWDDETGTSAAAAAAGATTEAAKTAIEAGGQQRVAHPAAVPNQTQAEDPSATADLSVAGATTMAAAAATGAAATEAAPAGDDKAKVDFSAHLKKTEVDEELEKRRRRAEKFGTAGDQASQEAIKALERAKRFGTGAADSTTTDAAEAGPGTGAGAGAGLGVSRLDSALPERPLRGAGRKRAADDAGSAGAAAGAYDDPGLKKRRSQGARQGGRGGPGPRRGAPRGASQGQGQGQQRGAGRLSEADRAKAEARKARFAKT